MYFFLIIFSDFLNIISSYLLGINVLTACWTFYLLIHKIVWKHFFITIDCILHFSILVILYKHSEGNYDWPGSVHRYFRLLASSSAKENVSFVMTCLLGLCIWLKKMSYFVTSLQISTGCQVKSSDCMVSKIIMDHP